MAGKATLKSSTIMSAFGQSKTEVEMRNTLDRYAKKGINLFDLMTESLRSSPAYAMLWGGHHKLLWALMDEKNINPLQPNSEMVNVPAILWAATANDKGFITEWHNRGLPMDDPTWINAPLITALMNNSNESVKELSNVGADWCKEREVEYQFGVKDSGLPRILTMKTAPWAIALVQGQTSNVKLAVDAKKSFQLSDFEFQTPHQSWFYWNPQKRAENMSIGSFFNKQLTGDKEIRNFYSTTYWKHLNSAKFIDAIKKTPYGKDIDWESIRTGNTDLRVIFKAVVRKEDKVLSKETQEILLQLFVKNDRVSDVQAYASSARCKDLWNSKGLLGDKPYNESISLSSWRARNLYEEDRKLPLFPMVVLRNIKTPAWWRAGAANKNYNNQFWDFLGKATTKMYQQGAQTSWNSRTVPLMEFFPSEFSLTSSYTSSNKKAVFKQLDIMYEFADKNKVKSVFDNFLKTKPRLFNGEWSHSSYYVLSFAHPLEWAISKKIISAKDVLNVISKSPNDTPQWAWQRLGPWVNSLEHSLLKEKVIDVETPVKDSRLSSAL